MKREGYELLAVESKRIDTMRTIEERDAHRHGTPARWIRQKGNGEHDYSRVFKVNVIGCSLLTVTESGRHELMATDLWKKIRDQFQDLVVALAILVKEIVIAAAVFLTGHGLGWLLRSLSANGDHADLIKNISDWEPYSC
jgi:hypothetical protein